MAKKTDLTEASHEALTEELLRRLNASEGAEEDAEFPDAEAIEAMDLEELQALADKVNLDHEDVEEDDLKAMLLNIHKIGVDDTEELDAGEIKALCLALSIKPTKKLSENVGAIKTLISGDEGEAEAEAEDADAEEDETPKKKKKGDDDDAEEGAEEEDETPKKKKKGEEEEEGEAEGEEVDAAAVVKEKGKYPDEDTMTERLDAYNEASEDKISAKKLGGVKKAYAKLLEQLVDSEGNLAKWGVPYVKDGEGWCCGLVMEDTKVKGSKDTYGKCLVTEKLYSLDEEGDFVENED